MLPLTQTEWQQRSSRPGGRGQGSLREGWNEKSSPRTVGTGEQPCFKSPLLAAHPGAAGRQSPKPERQPSAPQPSGSPAPGLDLQLPPVTCHSLEEKRPFVAWGDKWVNDYIFNQAERISSAIKRVEERPTEPPGVITSLTEMSDLNYNTWIYIEKECILYHKNCTDRLLSGDNEGKWQHIFLEGKTTKRFLPLCILLVSVSRGWTESDIKADYKQCMTNTLHPEVEPTVVSISLTTDIKKKNIKKTAATIRSIAMVLITCRRCQMQSRRTNKTIMRAKKQNGRRAPACSFYL